MALTLVTPPAAEPISVAELKAHSRITSSAEDSLLAIYISAARQKCEGILGRVIINQTWAQTLDEFPSNYQGRIKLMMPKVSSITTLAYTDDAGAAQTLTGSDYTLVSDALPGYLYPTDDYWPATDDVPNAVTITYVAGFGATSASVPDDIRAWCLLTAAFLYAQRESFDGTGRLADLPNRFCDSLLDKWRVFGV